MPTYNALVDSATNILLTTHIYAPAILFLEDCTVDTLCVPGVNYPAYDNGSWFVKDRLRRIVSKPDQYTNWAWQFGSHTFSKAQPELVTSEIKAQSKLLTAKAVTIAQIMRNVSYGRLKSLTGVGFQDVIYLTKRLQAQKLKDAAYDKSIAAEIPYIAQYAEYANIPLSQAADDILFKAALSDEVLSRTESIRIEYFNEVRVATKLEELVLIADRARVACFGNMLS